MFVLFFRRENDFEDDFEILNDRVNDWCNLVDSYPRMVKESMEGLSWIFHDRYYCEIERRDWNKIKIELPSSEKN